MDMKCQNIVINTINPIKKIKYPPTKQPSVYHRDLDFFYYMPTDKETLSKIKNLDEIKRWFPKFEYELSKGKYEFSTTKDKEDLLEMFKQKPEFVTTLLTTTLSKENIDTPIFTPRAIREIFNTDCDLDKLKFLIDYYTNQETEANSSPHSKAADLEFYLHNFKDIPLDILKSIYLTGTCPNFVDKFSLLNMSNKNPDAYRLMEESGVFEMINNNKLDSNILKSVGYNKTLNDEVLNDIVKMQNNESSIKILPNNTAPNDIPKLAEIGEVCEINNKLYVANKDSIEQINLTKEKFEELFPIFERNLIKQGNLGDCWVLAAIDAIMDIPAGKAKIYSLFEQDGNDILIKFPNKDKKIRFKDGKPIEAKKGLEGALGYKLLEQAFAIHFKNHYPKNNNEVVVNDLSGVFESYLNELEGGFSINAVKAFVGHKSSLKEKFYDFIGKEPDIDKILKEGANDKNSITFLSFAEKNNVYKKTLANNYGIITKHAYALKGYKPESDTILLSNPHDTKSLIEVPASIARASYNHIGMVKI